MSDTETTYYDEDGNPVSLSELLEANKPKGENSNLRQLREQAKKGVELESQTESLRRENVLLKAGLTLSERQVKALSAAHEGEWSPDALKATATELGFVKDEQASAEAAAAASAELDGLAQMRQAATQGRQVASTDFITDLDAAGHDRAQIMAAVRKHGLLTTDRFEEVG